LQIAKFLIKNDIYNLDHNIDTKFSAKKKILSSLSAAKVLIEDLKLNELNDDQLIKLLPVIIMINNVYGLKDFVVNNIIMEITGRLKINSSFYKSYKDYLRFILVQNKCKQSYSILNFLIEFKDVILTLDSNTNDLLYILTDNIHKFIVNKDEKTEDYVHSFNKFINIYCNTKVLISESNDINEDILENMFSAIYLLAKGHDISYSVKLSFNDLLKQIFETRDDKFINDFYTNNNYISLLTGLEIDSLCLKEFYPESANIFNNFTELGKLNPTLRKEIVAYYGLESNYSKNKEK
jgi:hypothetical protein